MKIATLGVITRGDKVLLGEKKKGEIGTGIICGPGGKKDAGDKTIEDCMLREIREELEIEPDPASLDLAARIDFYTQTEIDFRVYIYLVGILSGEIHETADMIPNWYPVASPPFDRTYEADRHWLPKVLAGEKFCARAYYRERAKNFDRIEFLPFGRMRLFFHRLVARTKLALS